MFSELPPGKVVTTKVVSVVDYGVFVRVRDGIEGLIAQSDLVLPKDENGEPKELHPGDDIEAEVANIDTQERRLTLSMRGSRGETPSSAPEAKQTQRTPKSPKKVTAAEAAAGGTIGELIKQKLGDKLAAIGDGKGEDGKKDDDE
jgi:small subunit ribosomal protein S1